MILPSPSIDLSLRLWANVSSPLSGVCASLDLFFKILLKKPPDLWGRKKIKRNRHLRNKKNMFHNQDYLDRNSGDDQSELSIVQLKNKINVCLFCSYVTVKLRNVSTYLSGVVVLEGSESGCPEPSWCLFLKELDLELSPWPSCGWFTCRVTKTVKNLKINHVNKETPAEFIILPNSSCCIFHQFYTFQ